MRTSITHPLLIAEIQPFDGFGKIGITFCPGKVQARSISGPWARDLDTDLDAIADWNAAAVLTLIEEHELNALQVRDMGAKVAARHMTWHHLPIVDVSTPDAAFEQAWRTVGEDLRARLRSGANVLVHCRGGLGRAGTVAARLLVELGWKATDAMKAVRKVRPGAIETRAQEHHVRSVGVICEPQPDTGHDATRDRALGALIGLAVGDALGTTLEFRSRDTYPRLIDMIGGGPFGLEAGQWTDDTSLALALADSLLADSSLDEADLMRRFVRWHEEGEYSVLGRCFDIGVTTRQALARWKRTGDPVAGSNAPTMAGNGSLMRLAPVAVRHWRDRAMLRDVAARQSATTHGAPESVDACVAYAELLADAISGAPRSEVLRARKGAWAGVVAPIMAGRWQGKARGAIRASGYVAHSLEAALWCIARTTNFADAVLLAANLGEDADTTAAIVGQLAGALYGASGIPSRWREKLAWGERIARMAEELFDAGDIATQASWPDLQPLPERRVTIPLDLYFDAKHATRLRQGFIPVMQEEKWFAWFADGILRQHRSWTGICIDEVHFMAESSGLRATHAEVNRDPEQYGETDDAADTARIAEMVTGLADLPSGARSKAIDPMVTALHKAMQPGYLGSPDVVHALVQPIVETAIGIWRARTDKTAPPVTPADEQSAASRLIAALCGQDSAFTTMPWHCVEQLGANLILAMGLDADYCAGETLEFLLVEAVAAFRLHLHTCLREYVYAPELEWGHDTQPKIVWAARFFEAVLLGTNSVLFAGKTIDDTA